MKSILTEREEKLIEIVREQVEKFKIDWEKIRHKVFLLLIDRRLDKKTKEITRKIFEFNLDMQLKCYLKVTAHVNGDFEVAIDTNLDEILEIFHDSERFINYGSWFISEQNGIVSIDEEKYFDEDSLDSAIPFLEIPTC